MKHLILLLLFPLTFAVKTQDSTSVNDASVRALTKSGYLTLFIGKEIQNTGLDEYLQKDFDCRTYGKRTAVTLKNGDILLSYGFIRSIPGENKQTPIHITWTMTSKGGSTGKGGVIKKLQLSGNWADVAELFLFYWPTTVTAEEIKNKKAAVERLISDKIIYESSGHDQATITIVHI